MGGWRASGQGGKASRAAGPARGEQAVPAVPADVAALLLAHRLDPADPALARCVVTALGVTELAVPPPPPPPGATVHSGPSIIVPP